MHEAKSKEIVAWLLKSSADLRAAEIDIEASPPLIEDALFHCQQAVEKALKAFLTWRDTPFPKTQDLDELGQMCIELDNGLESFLKPAAYLTVFAWEFRYPGEPEVPPRAEALKAKDLALHVYDAILKRFPEELTESMRSDS